MVLQKKNFISKDKNPPSSSLGLPTIFFKNKSLLNFKQISEHPLSLKSRSTVYKLNNDNRSLYGQKLSNRINENRSFELQKIQGAKMLENQSCKVRDILGSTQSINFKKSETSYDSKSVLNTDTSMKRINSDVKNDYEDILQSKRTKRSSPNRYLIRQLDKEFTLRDETFLENPFLFEKKIESSNIENTPKMNNMSSSVKEIQLKLVNPKVNNHVNSISSIKTIALKKVQVPKTIYKTKSISQLISEIDDRRLILPKTNAGNTVSNLTTQRFDNIKRLLSDIIPETQPLQSNLTFLEPTSNTYLDQVVPRTIESIISTDLIYPNNNAMEKNSQSNIPNLSHETNYPNTSTANSQDNNDLKKVTFSIHSITTSNSSIQSPFSTSSFGQQIKTPQNPMIFDRKVDSISNNTNIFPSINLSIPPPAFSSSENVTTTLSSSNTFIQQSPFNKLSEISSKSISSPTETFEKNVATVQSSNIFAFGSNKDSESKFNLKDSSRKIEESTSVSNDVFNIPLSEKTISSAANIITKPNVESLTSFPTEIFGNNIKTPQPLGTFSFVQNKSNDIQTVNIVPNKVVDSPFVFQSKFDTSSSNNTKFSNFTTISSHNINENITSSTTAMFGYAASKPSSIFTLSQNKNDENKNIFLPDTGNTSKTEAVQFTIQNKSDNTIPSTKTNSIFNQTSICSNNSGVITKPSIESLPSRSVEISVTSANSSKNSNIFDCRQNQVNIDKDSPFNFSNEKLTIKKVITNDQINIGQTAKSGTGSFSFSVKETPKDENTKRINNEFPKIVTEFPSTNDASKMTSIFKQSENVDSNLKSNSIFSKTTNMNVTFDKNEEKSTPGNAIDISDGISKKTDQSIFNRVNNNSPVEAFPGTKTVSTSSNMFGQSSLFGISNKSNIDSCESIFSKSITPKSVFNVTECKSDVQKSTFITSSAIAPNSFSFTSQNSTVESNKEVFGQNVPKDKSQTSSIVVQGTNSYPFTSKNSTVESSKEVFGQNVPQDKSQTSSTVFHSTSKSFGENDSVTAPPAYTSIFSKNSQLNDANKSVGIFGQNIQSKSDTVVVSQTESSSDFKFGQKTNNLFSKNVSAESEGKMNIFKQTLDSNSNNDRGNNIFCSTPSTEPFKFGSNNNANTVTFKESESSIFQKKATNIFAKDSKEESSSESVGFKFQTPSENILQKQNNYNINNNDGFPSSGGITKIVINNTNDSKSTNSRDRVIIKRRL